MARLMMSCRSRRWLRRGVMTCRVASGLAWSDYAIVTVGMCRACCGESRPRRVNAATISCAAAAVKYFRPDEYAEFLEGNADILAGERRRWWRYPKRRVRGGEAR